VVEAFDMIIDSITETKMSYRKIAKLSLVLFHQNNLSCNNSSTIFHTLISELFYTKGLCSSRGKPFPTPRIVYWNISGSGCCQLPFKPFRISNETPTNDNVFVLSGLSSSLIRYLYLLDNVCPISPKNHHSNISYDLIYNILDNNRYDVLGNYLINLSM
jgi:hypothetical protein